MLYDDAFLMLNRVRLQLEAIASSSCEPGSNRSTTLNKKNNSLGSWRVAFGLASSLMMLSDRDHCIMENDETLQQHSTKCINEDFTFINTLRGKRQRDDINWRCHGKLIHALQRQQSCFIK
jgi:hypothetical protein